MNRFKMTIAALTMASLLLTGCGAEENTDTTESSGTSAAAAADKTPAEKTAALLDAVEFPEMVEVTADKLLAYYGIDAADVTEMSAYRVGSGAFPDQFGVFVAADAEAADRVKTAVEAYVESERADFTDYTPAEMYKFDDCFIKLDGNTVYYAVCADNAAAEEILG